MKQLKCGISAFVPVYNEEKRIAFTLQSLSWCNEVVLVDKNSTDKTVEIAQQFSNVRIIYQENTKAYSSSEFDVYFNECQYKYTMTVTASDIIHPNLARKIKALVSDESFNYDAIRVPYKGYFLGVYEKFSPWYKENGTVVVKFAALRIRENEVHTACVSEIHTIYNIEAESSEEAYYHLTHESADGVVDRHIRYWRGEACSPEPLSVSLKMVIRKSIRFFVIKRTFFKGKAAIALAFSYLCYFMMSYVYKWDYLYGNADEVYSDIRKSICKEWEKEN